MKFKCFTKGSWINYRRFLWFKFEKRESGPATNDIVTCDGCYIDNGSTYLFFIEWPGKSFNSIHFVKVDEEGDAAVAGAKAIVSRHLKYNPL